MKKKLTPLQAFCAMRKFLEDYYYRTMSDDIGSLLGDLQLLQDNETADPAAWVDWMQSVNFALKNSEQSQEEKQNI